MKRTDGRTPGQIRRVKMTRRVNKFAEGSCLIQIGHTRVMCTASVEEQVPLFLRDSGKGWVTAEYGMLPRSCVSRTQREAGRGKIGGRTQEIQRLIGRSLRQAVNLDMLGPRTIWVDCDVMQADGGTRTASITGGFVALYDALRHLVKNGVIHKNPCQGVLSAISVGILDSCSLLDLNYQEDVACEVDMNVVMTASGRFVEIQGTGEGRSFSKKEFDQMILLAKKGIGELIRHQKKALGL
ncbi:MAG: ribonuclease PH [Candidatus Omnitrophica bacterium]|nr:ribonuclease PH [Candidatus Omnitrophota bacterium]